MSFTLETTLASNEPNVVVILGAPNPLTEFEIFGKLDLHVHNEVELAQLVVAFNGEAYEENEKNKSQSVNIARSEFHALQAPTVFQPGKYDFSFRLRVPGDVAATHFQKIKGFSWGYELIAVGEPSNLSESNARQVVRQPLTLKRVFTPPQGSPSLKYRISRTEYLECMIHIPKIVDVKETNLQLSVDFREINKCPGVKKIGVELVQTRVLNFDYSQLVGGFRRFWVIQPTTLFPEDSTVPGLMISNPPHADTVTSRRILSKLKIYNPHRKSSKIEAWGFNKPIEFNMEINSMKLLPRETLEWLSITHEVHFTITFINEGVPQMKFTAPIQFGHVASESESPPEYVGFNSSLEYDEKQ
ncbi:hypothetical protein BGX27_008064 [Mortierella sp. AM989]|nr:hypothetical protein BGX27_008064 [Mortierella sp. AM989]